MEISTPDDNRPESNANTEEEPITLSPPGPSEIRVRPPISKSLAKGQSIQNSGKGKSGKSVYDPNKVPKDDRE